MKITLCESRKKIDSLKKNESLIPLVVERVFTICKEDKNFSIKEDIGSIEQRMKMLKQKNEKQDSLLTQSNEMKATLLSKIKANKDESFSIKVKLLEALGSDI